MGRDYSPARFRGKVRVLKNRFHNIQLHTSVLPLAQAAALKASLRENRIPGAFFYLGPDAAVLWSRLHNAHAPSQNEDSSRSLYAAKLSSKTRAESPERLHLISLGCGMAEKEARLVGANRGRWSRATAIDAGIELVACAADRIQRLDEFEQVDAKAVDLGLVEDWSTLVADGGRIPRLITAFGMIPNCDPELFLNQLLTLVRPGDYLLIDANLIPDSLASGDKIPDSIMVQYDNRECAEWLMAGLTQLGLTSADGDLQFDQDRVADANPRSRIVVDFLFGRSVKLEVADVQCLYQAGDRLRVFYSNRFRRTDIPGYLQNLGCSLLFEEISLTGEDGLYLFRRDRVDR